jgi:hypothetical protein
MKLKICNHELELKKFPIIIFSNYRTGSTALGYYLAKKTGLPFLNEPIYEHHKKYLDLLLSYRESDNKNYILNFMAEHAEQDDFYKKILEEDSFKIKLQRKNKIDQISSFYIAYMTDNWATINTTNVNEYDIKIDLYAIKHAIKKILYSDSLLDSCKTKFDFSLIYEDLGFLDDIHLKLTIPPKNITLIKKLVKTLLPRHDL